MATARGGGKRSGQTDVHRTGRRIDAIHHDRGEKRFLIPSREEAGMEDDNPIVQAKHTAGYALNPVTTRGQDPELYWMHKYGPGDDETRLKIDIRSLYRHEHVEPETLIHRLYKITKSETPQNDMFVNETFGNLLGGIDELDKPKQYYRHAQNWRNRLIQGDSLLVMTSLLEREGMAGKVQMIYVDPPYGIRYGSNWQMRLNDRNVKDADDANLSGEPEVIKAFRDTWELGIHSYLGYLRDRLLVVRELLTESGSCFVQIGDENVHLVRALLDEVFGSANFVNEIPFKTTVPLSSDFLAATNDYLLWYAKDRTLCKYRQLYVDRESGEKSRYSNVELPDGTRRALTKEEKENPELLPKGSKVFADMDLASSGYTPSCIYDFEYKGKTYRTSSGKSWKTTKVGMQRLAEKARITDSGKTIRYVLFFDDSPMTKLANFWADTTGELVKFFVVQTHTKIVQSG